MSSNAKLPMSRPPRMAPLEESAMTPDQARLVESYRLNGSILNVVKLFVRNFAFFKVYKPFGIYSASRSSLPPRLRELAILRVLWLNRCDYEWGLHVRIGLEVGFTAIEIEAIKTWPDAHDWPALDRIILAAVDEIKATADLSDLAYQALQIHLSDEQMLDFVLTIGNYAMLSTALNVFRTPRDPNVIGLDQPVSQS